MTIAPAREVGRRKKHDYAYIRHCLPCMKCRYPMIPLDRGKSPRCKAGKNWRVFP